jgi:hypothetical protein
MVGYDQLGRCQMQKHIENFYTVKSYLRVCNTLEKFLKWPCFGSFIHPYLPILTSNLAIHKVKEFYWIRGET